MSLTKLVIYRAGIIFPPRERLLSDIPAGEWMGMSLTFFYNAYLTYVGRKSYKGQRRSQYMVMIVDEVGLSQFRRH
jgi:hypothetical protein